MSSEDGGWDPKYSHPSPPLSTSIPQLTEPLIGSQESWPWVRSLPFGTAFDLGHLDRIRAIQKDALERRIFFAFRGTGGFAKRLRVSLAAAVNSRHAQFTRIAELGLKHVPRHPSGVGPFLVDVTDPSSHPHYQTADNISYLELLQESIFTVCPPGKFPQTLQTRRLVTHESHYSTCYLLLATRYSPLATRHSPLATRHSPLATRYSLLASR